MSVVSSIVFQTIVRVIVIIANALKGTRWSWAWFGGANLKVLKDAETDQPFFDVLGITVLALSVVSGFAATVAAGYMFDASPLSLWWLGLGWTLLLSCAIERLVLQIDARRKALLPFVVLQRLLLSVLLAVAFGEPLMLLINHDKVDNVMGAQQKSAVAQVRSAANATFDPQIRVAKADINRLRRNEAKVKANMAHYRKIAACPSARCQYYGLRAAQRRDDLLALKRRHGGRIKGLKTKIQRLRTTKQEEIKQRTSAIKHDDGIIAREEALATLMKDNKHAAYNVWFFRLLFLVIDLLPVTMKLAHLLSGSEYERALAAARRKDAVKAEGSEWEAAVESERNMWKAKVESQRIKDQALADIQANKLRIRAKAERDARETMSGRRDRRWFSFGSSEEHKHSEAPH